MIGYGLRFSMTFSLTGPVGAELLAQIIKIIVEENNKKRPRLLGSRHNQLTFINAFDSLNSGFRWIGVSAPYMEGKLLLCEPYSQEYGLSNTKFYTEVSMTYLRFGKLTNIMGYSEEKKLLETLQLIGRTLPEAVKHTRENMESQPAGA